MPEKRSDTLPGLSPSAPVTVVRPRMVSGKKTMLGLSAVRPDAAPPAIVPAPTRVVMRRNRTMLGLPAAGPPPMGDDNRAAARYCVAFPSSPASNRPPSFSRPRTASERRPTANVALHRGPRLTIDSKGRIIWANCAACGLLGYRPDQISGLALNTLVGEPSMTSRLSVMIMYGITRPEAATVVTAGRGLVRVSVTSEVDVSGMSMHLALER